MDGGELRKIVKGIPGVSFGMDSRASLTQRMSTGCTPLDCTLLGGIPCGRITEIFGGFSEGKSTLAEHILAGNQKAGGVSILIASESSLDPERSRRIGVDLEGLMIKEADTVEDGFHFICQVLTKLKSLRDTQEFPICIVWDTLAAAPTETEKKIYLEAGTMEEWRKQRYSEGMLDRPKKIREGMRIIDSEISRTRTAMIFCNQTIEGPGQHFSYVPETPGGGGLKFHASLRLWIRRKTNIQDDENVARGVLSEVIITKSKVCPPMRKVIVPIYFDSGIDDDEAMFHFLGDRGFVFRTAGGWRYMTMPDGTEKTFRKDGYREILVEDPSLREYLKECCRNVPA